MKRPILLPPLTWSAHGVCARYRLMHATAYFSYPYFRCRFRNVDGKVFFEKTTGSQRKSGFVYQNGPKSLAFLGGWSVNDEPQTLYGAENSVAGVLYKIGTRRAIILFPTSADRVEIYELIK